MRASVSAFLDGRGSPDLARSILASRNAVRDRLCSSASASNARSILLDVLAEALIDRCAQAAAAGSVAPLAEWAAATCHARPDAPSVRNLFLSIGPTLTDEIGEDGFDVLTAALTPILDSLRPPQTDGGVDTIDELDVLLADLVARVEHNDPMTAEHCRAVSAWCGRIAQRLALTRSETAFVARGGLIHDVGKSVTPLEILLAARPLTESEWVVMREHTLAGHEIVRDDVHLREFAGVVRSHHERYDGRGYPDQLDRANISIATRIVTVADAFNAMIGRRPYRTPLSPDRAAHELLRNAGTQFDPNVVEALIDVVHGGHRHALTNGALA